MPRRRGKKAVFVKYQRGKKPVEPLRIEAVWVCSVIRTETNGAETRWHKTFGDVAEARAYSIGKDINLIGVETFSTIDRKIPAITVDQWSDVITLQSIAKRKPLRKNARAWKMAPGKTRRMSDA